jgi:hypothetical protein
MIKRENLIQTNNARRGVSLRPASFAHQCHLWKIGLAERCEAMPYCATVISVSLTSLNHPVISSRIHAVHFFNRLHCQLCKVIHWL